LDGGIGAVIGGFEPAVGTVLRIWLVMDFPDMGFFVEIKAPRRASASLAL
jgi:hypothetical protein